MCMYSVEPFEYVLGRVYICTFIFLCAGLFFLLSSAISATSVGEVKKGGLFLLELILFSRLPSNGP